ncbi:MAG TPA: TonB-dependent receptor [Vicinamibacterales bacterium]
MTRKSGRKRRPHALEPSHHRPTTRTSVPWVTALVATAAVGLRPSLASAHESPLTERDARLAVIDAVLRSSNSVLGEQVRRFAFQDQNGSSPAVHPYDIAAGPLNGVIIGFEHVSGVHVTLALASIGSIQSPGISGAYDAEHALQAMLAGTGVGFRISSPTAAVLDLATLAADVEVVGRAPETMVSSPKYVVPLKDVPQTIAVVPRAVMDQQGSTTLTEALRNVPGITLQAGEGGGASRTTGDMFNMRGFSTNNSVFVDGVRNDGLIARDVFNIEQVEVFMGPTGSDVGRGTAGGYVNMATKTPHLSAGYSLQYGYGTPDQNRLLFDVNQPLAIGAAGTWLGTSSLRLNGVWQDSGVPGRDLVELGTKGIAPSLAIGLGTPTRVFVSEETLRENNLPDYGLPGAAWQANALTPTTVRVSQPVDQSNYYGNVTDFDHGSEDNLTARVEHDVNARLTVRNQTLYNRTHREAIITSIQNPAAYTPTTNMVALSRQGNEQTNSILSNQANLLDRFTTGGLRHALSAGVEYTAEAFDTPTLGGLGTVAPVSIYAPDPNAPIADFAPAETGASSHAQTQTIALYAFDSVDLNARWQVNGGLRWEHYDTAFKAIGTNAVATTDEHVQDGLFSGKAALLYKITDAGNVYFSYGTTATPPGTANFTLSSAVNNQNNPNVKPQQAANYEVGSKWDLAGGRASLTSAVFHSVNRNVIFTVDATAIPPVYNQADSQTVNGVTVGASGRVRTPWQVLANVSYLNGRMDSQGVNNDHRLTLTPEWSGSVWTTYQLPRRVLIGGGVRASGDVFIDVANIIRQPGYHVIDGLAEYEVNTHLTLRLNLRNLTNEAYIVSVNNNGGRYNPGNPRSAQVTSVVRF